MAENPTPESLEFKAEVQQLLSILSHSLYKEREIFLRELISNASDALHRMQFEMLTNQNVLDPEAELAIHIDVDEEANTLTIRDTGVGMTHAELVENLGTIAHSGAMAFLKQIDGDNRIDEIIGQFGVGFYAVFMAAEEVRVTTRSFQPEAQAWTWTSSGDSTYTIAPADKTTRGTEIEVQLKEEAKEFASPWRIKQIVKKHSNYVSFPIYVGDEVANEQTALWREPPSQVDDDAYDEFYRQISLDFEPPLLHIHIAADVPVEVRSILYVPQSGQRGALRARTDYGLKLYSRKVLIQEDNKDLLPEYLRFVEGVVDSADVPLNVARETVQSTRTIGHIKKALRSRILKELNQLGEEDTERYATFWREFGAFIKEGVTTDFGGRDDLLPLLRFQTSKSSGELTSLAAYAERMGEDQDAIYYILGDSVETVANSPHLDYFKSNDLEVLYLVDPLDAFMVQGLQQYGEKPLKNVDDPDLELPEKEEEAAKDEETKPEVEAELFGKLLVRFKDVLGDRVVEVRESKVLKDSPCRLVSPEGGPQHDMERVRRLLEQDYEIPSKILEVNRNHPLIHNLAETIGEKPAAPVISLTIEQLFENMLLIEGLHPNPAQMVPRIQKLLEQATKG